MKAKGWVLLAGLLLQRAEAGTVLFDFDNANPYTPLPITLSVGGITAQFTGTGQGYSIQRANTLGFTPVGFSGNCVYPSSVYTADLRIAFSALLTNFAILYAPEEYACDSSARMRVTAFRDGTQVGSATTNAQAGTWPTETLRFASAQGFNSVVVHYDAPPVTGGDWGPVFLADNLMVTPAARPSATAILLVNPTILPDGTFQCSFTNTPGLTFTVLASPDPSAASDMWTVMGVAAETAPGQYQITDPPAGNGTSRFYRVRSP